MIFEHKPVLLNECLDSLNIKPNGIYVDGTVGGAGHSVQILKRLNEGGLLIGLDQDEYAVRVSAGRLAEYGRQIKDEYMNNLYTSTNDKCSKYTKHEESETTTTEITAKDIEGFTKEKDKQNTKDKINEFTKDEGQLSTKDKLPKFMVIRTNFENIKNILTRLGINEVDGILLDIGVSSHQIDEPDRGFSYINNAPLDMRMSQENDFSAKNVVNEYSEQELCKLIREYGEENWAKRIAGLIVERRKIKSIDTTGELVDVINRAIPKGARSEDGHPAKRVFQAVRIEVNRELDVLNRVIDDSIPLLKNGGRLCIISFHSLEDRIIKTKFQNLAKSCVCPKEFPVCICEKVPEVKIITRKPITSDKEELIDNKRAKSAKLRVIERIYKR